MCEISWIDYFFYFTGIAFWPALIMVGVLIFFAEQFAKRNEPVRHVGQIKRHIFHRRQA